MVRWVRPPQHPFPQAFYFVRVLLVLLFVSGRSSTGRWISFFSLTDVFQVLVGEDLNRTCRKLCLLPLFCLFVWLESFKRSFCNWFWCLLCAYLGPSTMYTISPILYFNYSTFPTGRVILIFFIVNLVSGLNFF